MPLHTEPEEGTGKFCTNLDLAFVSVTFPQFLRHIEGVVKPIFVNCRLLGSH